MKAIKTAIFAATLMSSASVMAAEVSGNVALSSDYLISLAAKPCQVALMSLLKAAST
ncbi:hypothetical protein N9R55_03055 [Porticoccaceae bacterium]|nr:hypothetical protein [Porticoccaceae bacterium]